MRVNTDKLDDQVKFLREQASRLRDLAARQSGSRWAEGNARKFEEIAEFLLEARRESQMTGMHGKRIE